MAAKTKSFATAEDSAEVSLEIWADGPKAESEIADKPGSPGSPLLLTDFSRSCATLWRSIFGARFACREPRKDTGRTFPERIVGTSEGVRAQHGRALKRLVGVAGADRLNAPASSRRTTIFGFRRNSLEKSTVEAAPQNKKFKNFCRRTDELVKARGAHEVWNGCSDKVTLRRKWLLWEHRVNICQKSARLQQDLQSLRPRGALNKFTP